MDIYRTPIFVIKNMLKTGVIPYLVVDYDRNSLSVLQYRNNYFILGNATMVDGNIPLVLGILPEQKIDDLIIDSTKVSVDNSIITIEMFNELIESLSVASDVVRSKMIKINENKKGQIFTDSDFITLTRLSNKARLDLDFWETD